MDKPKQLPKKWEFSVNWVNSRRSVFIQIDILPSLCFIIDKQSNEKYESHDCIHTPYISYSLYFQWFGFYVEIMYNKITNHE